MPARDKMLEDLSDKIGARYRSHVQRALQYEEEKLLDNALREWEELYVEARRQGKDVSLIQEHMQRVHKLLWQRKTFQKKDESNQALSTQEKGIDRGQSFGELKKTFRAELQERCLSQGIDLSHPSEENRSRIRSILDQILKEHLKNIPDSVSRKDLMEAIVNDVCGMGIIDPYMNDPSVTEIMINGTEIFFEQDGRQWPSDHPFESLEEVKSLIERIIPIMGRRTDESSALLEGRLPDGSRVDIVLPPAAPEGPLITIRKFSPPPLSQATCVEEGWISERIAAFFRLIVAGRQNVFITGRRGSGKTALLNLLCEFIPDEDRIFMIEDVAELRLAQRHVVRLEARQASFQGKGEISLQALFQKALRMRPGRMIVGDCRGPEVLDMVQAMNTGLTGLMSTAYGSSPRDLLARLEIMIEMADAALQTRTIRKQIAAAIDIVVWCTRLPDGMRRVASVCEVLPGKGDEPIQLLEIYHYDRLGVGEGESTAGLFRTTGHVPSFILEAPEFRRQAGVMGLFEPEAK